MTVRMPGAAGRLALPLRPDLLLERIRGEYREMPGLQLTHAQAARLLGVDPVACRALLDHLADLGFLRRRERGQYVLASER
jgi:predicted transcriptional regulator of viral defense system